MTDAQCTCQRPGLRGPDVHAIDCLTVAVAQPHAMVNDALEVFYPDNPEDADWFAREHGARFLNPSFAWEGAA